MPQLKNIQRASLLESVMNTTDVMLVYLDLDFNFVWVNQAYADTCKMRPADMIGKNHFDLYPHPENELIFKRVRETGLSVFYKDKPFEFPDQPERDVTYWDWSLSLDKDSNGNSYGLVFSLRDTTEFVRSRKALQQKDNELIFAAKTANLSYWEFDLSKNEFIFNDQFYALLKTSAEREGGYRMSLDNYSRRFVHPDDAPLVGSGTQKLIMSSNPNAIVEVEARVVCADGDVRWVFIRLMAERDKSGRAICIKGINLDITPNKQAELKLQEAKLVAEHANQDKSRFLAAISHDLRQPLSALSLYLSALENKLPASESKLLSNMESCVSSLNEMLSQLLDVSKLDAGVIIPNKVDFNFDYTLDHILTAYTASAQDKHLQIRFRKRGLIGHTDPILFQRIIGNIISNSIRYTESGGILICCRKRAGRTWVEVWDTGIGIPSDKTTEIFEEFKQLNNKERNDTKGVGLGLTIVSKMAQLLGLQISVRSKPGKGSVFAVEIPLGNAVQLMPQRIYFHKPLRIAVVEDNARVADSFVIALSNVGHQVIAASSREEILLLLKDTAPDIVISDFRLSGKENGYDVVEALRAKFGNQLPALIVTGDTNPTIIREMQSRQVSVMHKPLEFDALREKLAELTA